MYIFQDETKRTHNYGICIPAKKKSVEEALKIDVENRKIIGGMLLKRNKNGEQFLHCHAIVFDIKFDLNHKQGKVCCRRRPYDGTYNIPYIFHSAGFKTKCETGILDCNPP